MPGYLVNGQRDVAVEIPGTGGLTVTFKAAPSYGDDLHCDVVAAQAGAPAGMALSAADQRRYAEARTAAYVLARTAVMIVAWDLVDDGGQPLPIERESLERLTPAVGTWLAGEARQRFEGRPQEEEGPFERPSPEPSSAGAPDTPR